MLRRSFLTILAATPLVYVIPALAKTLLADAEILAATRDQLLPGFFGLCSELGVTGDLVLSHVPEPLSRGGAPTPCISISYNPGDRSERSLFSAQDIRNGSYRSRFTPLVTEWADRFRNTHKVYEEIKGDLPAGYYVTTKPGGVMVWNPGADLAFFVLDNRVEDGAYLGQLKPSLRCLIKNVKKNTEVMPEVVL